MPQNERRYEARDGDRPPRSSFSRDSSWQPRQREDGSEGRPRRESQYPPRDGARGDGAFDRRPRRSEFGDKPRRDSQYQSRRNDDGNLDTNPRRASEYQPRTGRKDGESFDGESKPRQRSSSFEGGWQRSREYPSHRGETRGENAPRDDSASGWRRPQRDSGFEGRPRRDSQYQGRRNEGHEEGQFDDKPRRRDSDFEGRPRRESPYRPRRDDTRGDDAQSFRGQARDNSDYQPRRSSQYESRRSDGGQRDASGNDNPSGWRPRQRESDFEDRPRRESQYQGRRNEGREEEHIDDRRRRRDSDSESKSQRWTHSETRSDNTGSLPRNLRLSTPTSAPYSPLKPKIHNPLADIPASELDPGFASRTDTKALPTSNLPSTFASPPLLPGLLASVKSVLGEEARPTAIQALALKHIVKEQDVKEDEGEGEKEWKQFLLASETGSGKSIAYLLPVLQGLKQAELARQSHPPPPTDAPKRAMNPRALILAPTHELSRQLAGFAKSLLHEVKLRVVCSSRANVSSAPTATARAAQMASTFSGSSSDSGEGEFTVDGRGAGEGRDVDVLVGTPTKVLEMVHGRGWDWVRRLKKKMEEERGSAIAEDDAEFVGMVERRVWTVGEPEAGLANVEWVVIDEADVLLDPDFQESTRKLLADIAAARGHPVPFIRELNLTSTPSTTTTTTTTATPEPPAYPFNLLLTTATIPSSLAAYLNTYHPTLTRLASPRLHKLPASLQTEYAAWSGGNRDKDIEKKIKRIWWADAVSSALAGEVIHAAESLPTGSPKSKVLVFCNKSARVEALGRYLEEAGIPNVALTSTSEGRKRGSNKHLDGFLRTPLNSPSSPLSSPTTTDGTPAEEAEDPHVLITTSLLSRGLDFSPSIKHVFIVDPPRNMVDFLHRAGRSGRAEMAGKVVVFGKEKGRGSRQSWLVKGRVRKVANK
ncbi:RNA helicase [Steccherinum ochraceum]|uniref:RNA helicase n=1 Tax=Steccherinum ochraceum TaxID=92696 RepID=A0A4R0RF16_9APHY|nr:RNA helicase [Steccherinum ochraceum]